MSKYSKILSCILFGVIILVIYEFWLKDAEFFTWIHTLGLLVIVSIISLLFSRMTRFHPIWVPILMTAGVVLGVAFVLLLDTLFTSNTHDLLGFEILKYAGAIFIFSLIGSLINRRSFS